MICADDALGLHARVAASTCARGGIYMHAWWYRLHAWRHTPDAACTRHACVQLQVGFPKPSGSFPRRPRQEGTAGQRAPTSVLQLHATSTDHTTTVRCSYMKYMAAVCRKFAETTLLGKVHALSHPERHKAVQPPAVAACAKAVEVRARAASPIEPHD